MKLVLLLTDEIKRTMPSSVKTIANWGGVTAVFPKGNNNMPLVVEGDHVYVEDTQENFINWLKPFDGVIVGNGSPQFQKFTVMHIK